MSNRMRPSAIDFDRVPLRQLKRMAHAADDVLEALRVLGNAGTNPVAQVLAHQGEFVESDHFPKGDVYDDRSAAQYYYHAHRPETGENGHFHTFIRAKGIPAGVKPAEYSGPAERPLGEDAICHLVAISMNRAGLPTGLFTTNRWVTGETFYAARQVIHLLDRFEIDHTYPCLATNRWISGLIRLFRPQIELLLVERDATIREWEERHPEGDAFEDRDLEITSHLPIDIDEQVARVDDAVQRRKKAAGGAS